MRLVSGRITIKRSTFAAVSERNAALPMSRKWRRLKPNPKAVSGKVNTKSAA